MILKLVDHIKKHVELNSADIENISNSFTIKTFAKKGHLLKESQICEESYFVIKGCLRLYSICQDDKEQIIQFSIENWWMSDFRSFENGAKSIYNIQALEDSVVAVLHRGDQSELFEKVPQLEKYFRIIFQNAYSASLWRINHIFCKTGEERYDQFIKLFPEFVQRIPQYMLASFLGLTEQLFENHMRNRAARSANNYFLFWFYEGRRCTAPIRCESP